MRDPFEAVPVRARQGLLIGSILVAGLVWLGVANPNALGMLGVLVFFFVVMIGFHELGHFVFAKRAGMKVSEFFIGFGPRIWSTTRGETEYGVKALPLGGYCKIVGMTNLEDVEPDDEPRTFRNATLWGKVSTLLAGPASHFVLAFVLMWAALGFGGEYKAFPQVDAVSAESPAARAGLRHGDTLLFIDNHRIESWTDASDAIHAAAGRTVEVVVRRNGETKVLQATLGSKNPDSGAKVGFLGVAPVQRMVDRSIGAAFIATPGKIVSVTAETVRGFGHVFSPSGMSAYVRNFTGAKSAQERTEAQNTRFMSPVGVGRYAYDAVDAGWVTVFGLLIAINVSVGLINLVPLIPFDGGHIAVAAYEALMSRVYRRKYHVDFRKLMPVAIATLAILGFIFVSSLFLDIANPVKNPF